MGSRDRERIMRKEQEIFTQVNAQNVPVSADVLDTLEQEVVNESVLRKYIRELLTESTDEVAKIMNLWDHEEWDQARELAYMMGPEVSQHPDLKIWALVNGETGEIIVDELNYDQVMDPMYQAFQIFNSGYTVTTGKTEDNPWGHVAGGASARTHPISQDKLNNAVETLRQEAQKVTVNKVDEEAFHIVTMLEEL